MRGKRGAGRFGAAVLPSARAVFIGARWGFNQREIADTPIKARKQLMYVWSITACLMDAHYHVSAYFFVGMYRISVFQIRPEPGPEPDFRI